MVRTAWRPADVDMTAGSAAAVSAAKAATAARPLARARSQDPTAPDQLHQFMYIRLCSAKVPARACAPCAAPSVRWQACVHRSQTWPKPGVHHHAGTAHAKIDETRLPTAYLLPELLPLSLALPSLSAPVWAARAAVRCIGACWCKPLWCCCSCTGSQRGGRSAVSRLGQLGCIL